MMLLAGGFDSELSRESRKESAESQLLCSTAQWKLQASGSTLRLRGDVSWSGSRGGSGVLSEIGITVRRFAPPHLSLVRGFSKS